MFLFFFFTRRNTYFFSVKMILKFGDVFNFNDFVLYPDHVFELSMTEYTKYVNYP